MNNILFNKSLNSFIKYSSINKININKLLFCSQIQNNNKVTGIVKWFSSPKGFGFITITNDNNTTEDCFVHHSSIYAKGFRSLADGEKVEFDIEIDSKGRKQAINVTGPNGSYVEGVPRIQRRPDEFDFDNQ